MRYRECIEYLYALESRGISPGLSRVQKALALRGDPQLAYPCVLVAGTNGKGSVATSIATVLHAAGHKVGLYTSPHLHRLVERFQIAGRPVSERALTREVNALRRFVETPGTPTLTFFELGTLLAFELFRAARCDVVVLEVGLGGRLDATNVVTPLVSVITSIALDHTDRLGPTLAHVAREKAGIIKPGVPVVVGERAADALRVIRARAKKVGAPLYTIDREFSVSATGERLCVSVGERRIDRLRTPLRGAYQADNLTCAVTALLQLPSGFLVDERSLRRGLARVRWPGRLELLAGTPAVLCDAAHNPHAARALAEHVARIRGDYTRVVLLFGAMRDKDHAQMLDLLRPHVDALIFARAHTPRAESAALLAERHGGLALERVPAALSRARKLAGKRGLIIACGSIFLMAEVRARVLAVSADPSIAL
jgi:dihydrofolate synthase / folylpolyglutamate synthase